MNFRILVFAVAMACMLYELILAQLFSALLGNTLLRYSMTIGLYLAALGAGSLLVKPGPAEELRKRLFAIETALILLGGLSPLIAIGGEWLLRSFLDPSSTGFMVAAYVLSAVLTFAIGFLAGMELPLLIHWGERDFKISSGQVLFWDYAGTLSAVLLFIFVLLPQLGLLLAAGVCGFISCAAAVATIRWPTRIRAGRQPLTWFAAGTALVALIVVFHRQSWLVFERIYLGS